MEEETLKNFEESVPDVSDGALAGIRRELESYRGKYHDLLSETKRLEQELAAARKSAEQASRDKSEFLANMSHELRTPLNAITGLTRMLAEMNPDREAAKHLSMILTSADSLRRLIDHILDYARIEADTLDLDTEPFDLGDLLDRCRTAFSEKARRKGLDLRFRLMDIHMPGMDGVEATRRIRDGIGGGKVDPDIPIIALTAYAMKGDRDRFLDAGMDEYVAKPVDIDALRAVMDRMVSGSGGSVGGPPRRDRFKEIDGLFETFKEDERILGRMVRGFLAEAPPLLRDLRARYEAGDLGAAADAAHAMANLAVAVRALGLVNLSRDFECAARGGEVEEGRRLYGELLVEVEAVTSHVAALPLPEAAGEEHHEG